MTGVTVCIPTYRRPESLSMALASLLPFEGLFDEVLIGVTGPRELSFPDVDFLEQVSEAVGYSAVVKVKTDLDGLLYAKQWFQAEAKNEVLLLMDDDAVLGRGYFDLLSHFNAPSVAAVSGSLQTARDVGYRDWSREPIRVTGEWANLVVYEKGTVEIRRKFQVYRTSSPRIFQCECLIGTALFIRKDCLKVDMAYQRGACAFEEIDFTYRLHRSGSRLVLDTSKTAWHLHAGGGNREMDRSLDKENLDYFVRKWGLGEGVSGETSVYR